MDCNRELSDWGRPEVRKRIEVESKSNRKMNIDAKVEVKLGVGGV